MNIMSVTIRDANIGKKNEKILILYKKIVYDFFFQKKNCYFAVKH